LGKKVKAGANSGYFGAVSVVLGRGNVALRTGQRLIWNRTNLKAVIAASVEQAAVTCVAILDRPTRCQHALVGVQDPRL
jgi:hypothetical protein